MARKRKRRPRGTGSVFPRKDGRWVGAISLGFDAAGYRQRIVVYGKGPTDTQEKLTKEIDRYRKGERPAGRDKRETVEAFLDRWVIDGCRAQERSKDNYRASIARVKKAFGGMKIDRVTPETIDAYVTAQGARKLGQRAILGDWKTLRAAFRCAMRWRLIAFDPSAGTQKPVYTPRKRQAMTVERARIFVQKAAQDALGALWLLALGTGLRPSEACRIRRDAIDLATRVAHVDRSITKTASGERDIPLPAFVVDALRKHQKTLLERGLAASPYLFPRGLAQTKRRKNRLDQMDRFTIRELWSTFREQIGDIVPPGFAFKDLRHAYSSLLKAVGAHPHDHKELMGHSDLNVTSGTYIHEIDDERRAVVDRMNDLLCPNETAGKSKDG